MGVRGGALGAALALGVVCLGAAAAVADQTPPSDWLTRRLFFFAGVDIARDTTFGWSGIVLAPLNRLDEDGARIRNLRRLWPLSLRHRRGAGRRQHGPNHLRRTAHRPAHRLRYGHARGLCRRARRASRAAGARPCEPGRRHQRRAQGIARNPLARAAKFRRHRVIERIDRLSLVYGARIVGPRIPVSVSTRRRNRGPRRRALFGASGPVC